MIKKEIDKLIKKKDSLDPNKESTEYALELVSKLEYQKENDLYLFNELGFSFMWNSLNRKAKKELINKLISNIEISRNQNYDIEINNIRFTDEFISKNNKEYLEYLNDILENNGIGIKYKEQITLKDLTKLEKDYYIYSTQKMENKEYTQMDLDKMYELFDEHFYYVGIIGCPLNQDGNIVDYLLLIPKTNVIYE